MLPYQNIPRNQYPQRYAIITSAIQTGNGQPIACTTSGPHGFSTGDLVGISGSGLYELDTLGTQPRVITVTGANTFTLNCSPWGGGGSHTGLTAIACDYSFPSTNTMQGADQILSFNQPVQDLADRTAALVQWSPSLVLVSKNTPTPSGTNTAVATRWTALVADLLATGEGWQPGDVLDISVSGSMSYNSAAPTWSVFAVGWWDTNNGSQASPIILPGVQYVSTATGANGSYNLHATVTNTENGTGASVSNSNHVATVTGLSGMTVVDIGLWLRLEGCATAGLNETCEIINCLSATSVQIFTPFVASIVDANNGSIAWGLCGSPVSAALLIAVDSGTPTLSWTAPSIVVDHYRPTIDPLLASLA
jgi:hypothetical protein